ncbi:MAG: hypothetical protein IT381_27700 [Deltaproteobacteria bacterium]|nr:hypothetical protein [Deltaproteobacteria bacterium]
MKARPFFLAAERFSLTMLVLLGPRLVVAGSLNDTIRPATEIVRFISGPLATVLVTFGLVGALVSLIFFGGQMIGRLLTSFFSGIALFMIERITQAIGDLAR